MLLIYGIICYVVIVNKWVLHLLFLMTLSDSRMHMLIRPDKKSAVVMFHNGIVKLEYHMQ